MKINWRVRIKNPYFWIGLFGVIMATLGAKPEDFTSWSLVWEEIKNVASNPFLLISVILAVIGVVTDPTTKGICDSRQAMGYIKPRDDGENTHDSNFGQ
ncbi:bacteriophage holin [Anaerotignum neopropionicum]|uniref:Bacteriophage holin n=1 Tax=Anaerotignum neopropionicum TaxID=36847 RepID=A0A136WBL8_9FIRM|nr:phage holin [Anaerotignum neopropionicum]KXL51888.1 bacteriophage holin [Anaerotignum neopropionicum]